MANPVFNKISKANYYQINLRNVGKINRLLISHFHNDFWGDEYLYFPESINLKRADPSIYCYVYDFGNFSKFLRNHHHYISRCTITQNTTLVYGSCKMIDSLYFFTKFDWYRKIFILRNIKTKFLTLKTTNTSYNEIAPSIKKEVGETLNYIFFIFRIKCITNHIF